MEARDHFEVIIIGCGIAGASLAHFLAERGVDDVLILEREPQPGFHSTSRSAGVLAELDPVPSVLALKRMSAPFLRDPTPGFAEHPLFERSGILATFQGELWQGVLRGLPSLQASGVAIEPLQPRQILERVPALKEGLFDGGLLLPEDGHIDVHGLLSSYLRQARRRGVELRCGLEVKGVEVERGRCVGVVSDAGRMGARWVVNAAGAWAGTIAELASAIPLGLTPLRRTVISFRSPEDLDTRRWPLVTNYSHPLYFSPEAGGLYASPMDEEPSEPCDAHPDDLGIALTIERLREQAPSLVPRSLRHSWAGLRTFAPDRGLVVGEDPLVKGFFWLAGQGGCGIATSPAVGRIAAELIADGHSEQPEARLLDPARFRGGESAGPAKP